MKPKIHIIGRGIIGLSIGYRLLQAGWHVTLVGPARRPGTASFAAVGVSSVKGIVNGRKPLFSAKIAGHHNLKSWLQEIQRDSGIIQSYLFKGVAEPYENMMGYDVIRDRVFHRIHTGCYRMEVLTSNDFRRLHKNHPLPLWATGTFFYPEDGWFDPLPVLSGLDEIHRLYGAKFIEAPVTRIIPSPNRGLILETTEGLVAADHALLASGAFSGEILLNSGISSLKHQAIHGQTLFGGCDEKSEGVIIRGKTSFAAFSGGFRFGSTSHLETTFEPTIADLSPDPKLASELRFSNLTAETLVPQAVWGIRARLKDREPALGKIALPNDRDLWAALGFYKNGLQLADLAAKSMVLELNNQGPSTLFQAFSPRRFFSS